MITQEELTAIYICIYKFIYICVYIYIYMHIHIYIHLFILDIMMTQDELTAADHLQEVLTQGIQVRYTYIYLHMYI
jgi:hypothetical protein